MFDVAIVGGGPAGCSAGVFTARYGLSTVVFDRGRSSLRRVAHLENYLGFPGGVDVETFYELAHEHVRQAGCDLREEMVASVERADEGFRLETGAGRCVEARRVVAATKYGDSYLETLDDGAMFVEEEYRGERIRYFDRDYPDDDGRTPVDGLYAAGAMGGAHDQAIVATGHGARVGKAVIEDVRHEEEGYPASVAVYYDWSVVEGGHGVDDWEATLRAEFDEKTADADLTARERTRLREAYVREHLAWELSRAEQRRRAERGRELLRRVVDDRDRPAGDDTRRDRRSS